MSMINLIKKIICPMCNKEYMFYPHTTRNQSVCIDCEKELYKQNRPPWNKNNPQLCGAIRFC